MIILLGVIRQNPVDPHLSHIEERVIDSAGTTTIGNEVTVVMSANPRVADVSSLVYKNGSQ